MLLSSMFFTILLILGGCGGNGNPSSGDRDDGGNIGPTLSVNGAQVYGVGALESNYTGLFTNFDYNSSLNDVFTGSVVSMTNGKLTINLGKPTGGLVSVKDFLEGLGNFERLTISDVTAKILFIDYFSGNCDYDDDYDDYYCGSGLYVLNTASPAYEYALIYADKEVTVSGNFEDCVGDDNTVYCNYRSSFSLNLQDGWNAVGILDFDVGDSDNNRPLFTNTANLSGSGAMKWFVWNDGDDSHLVVPAPKATPIPLAENTLTAGSIASGVFGSAVWYSFNVVSGATYYVGWDDRFSGNQTGTLDVIVSAVYSGGSAIFIEDDISPQSFAASRDGTVQIRVSPYSPGKTGTFAVAYGKGETMSGFVLGKRGVDGGALISQKRFKGRSNSFFRRF
jgi:hypothetical protein